VVLVTDGEQRSSLAAVRALGRVGHRVVVVSADGRSLAGASNTVDRDLAVPSSLTEPDRFAETVAGYVRAEGVDVVLPVTDASVLALLPRRQDLAPAILPFPTLAAFMAASDKAWAASAAERVGISVPEGTVVDTPEAAASLERTRPWTRVLKPTRSVAGGRKQAISYVEAGRDLDAAVRALPASAFPLLVQERVEGPGMGIFLLRWAGRTHAAFAHRRLREKPPSGGVSVLRESIPLDPALVERAEALLDLLDWRGVAMVELKVSALTGRAYLMEINGRLWGSLQLASDAGVDFPGRLVEVALGGDPGPAPPYPAGVRSRWTLGDLDHLILRLRHGREALQLPEGAPGRATAVAAFLRGFFPPIRSEVFRWSDPYPAAREARSWLRDLRASRASR
jgi:predicted ATP-grasp superfamily ATP-dependent carboligase